VEVADDRLEVADDLALERREQPQDACVAGWWGPMFSVSSSWRSPSPPTVARVTDSSRLRYSLVATSPSHSLEHRGSSLVVGEEDRLAAVGKSRRCGGPRSLGMRCGGGRDALELDAEHVVDLRLGVVRAGPHVRHGSKEGSLDRDARRERMRSTSHVDQLVVDPEPRLVGVVVDPVGRWRGAVAPLAQALERGVDGAARLQLGLLAEETVPVIESGRVAELLAISSRPVASGIRHDLLEFLRLVAPAPAQRRIALDHVASWRIRAPGPPGAAAARNVNVDRA